MSDAAPEVVADTAPKDAETATKADPRSQIEEAAQKAGWAPKDQWRGDPEGFIDAPDFILKAAAEVLPSMRKSLEQAQADAKDLRKTLADFQVHHSKSEQRAYERALADLELRQEQAVADNDVGAVKKITKEISELSKDVKDPEAKPDADPRKDPAFVQTFADWKAENPWFDTDETLGDFAAGYGAKLASQGVSPEKQLVEVAKKVREVFPDKFENPRRSAAAAVAGDGARPAKGGKTFADLPADAKAQCDDFVKNIKGFTRDQYVRDYDFG